MTNSISATEPIKAGVRFSGSPCCWGGFRGTEIPTTKPEHEFRIAVLGDSLTLAAQVDLKDTYCALLETLMQDKVEAQGAKFILCTIGHPSQVTPNLKTQQQVLETFELEHLFYPDDRLAELAQHKGFEFLSLSYGFAARETDKGLCLHGFDNDPGCWGH